MRPTKQLKNKSRTSLKVHKSQSSLNINRIYWIRSKTWTLSSSSWLSREALQRRRRRSVEEFLHFTVGFTKRREKLSFSTLSTKRRKTTRRCLWFARRFSKESTLPISRSSWCTSSPRGWNTFNLSQNRVDLTRSHQPKSRNVTLVIQITDRSFNY